MEPIAMLNADPLDILFENRNKSYGAYPLRKFYAQRLCISMGITLSAVVIFTSAYLYFKSSPLVVPRIEIPDIKIIELIQPPKKEIIPPPAKSPDPKPIATVRDVTIKIVDDNKVPPPIPDVDQLKVNAVGLKTSIGEPDNGQPQSNGNNATGPAVQNTDSTEEKDVVHEWAEVMPEFPGGIEALKRFLLKNLRMPETELESGTQVRVIARFVVDAEGRVSNVEITRPAETVFNVEVKRVISKMPDWKPGMQNHRPVAVYFSLPVNFVAAD